MIEQVLVVTLGFADIVMVASLGEAAVSGVSLVDSINNLINGLFGALATGGAVVCSHYFGSRNEKMVSLTAQQLIYSTIGISLIITVFGLMFQRDSLVLIFGKTEEAVMVNARIYFFFSLLSYPMIALYSGCAALFRAQGNSTVSMLTSLLVNILNIGGNFVCIFILKMGVAGVAVPTFISRAAAAFMLLFLLYKARPYAGRPAISIRGISRIHIDGKIIKHILAIGIPNGVENSMFQIGKILVLKVITQFGTTAIAANAAAGTLATFGTLPGSALGLAILTVVGQTLGAERTEEARYFTKTLMILSYIAIIIINIPLIIFADPLVGIFNMSSEAQLLTKKMFLFHNIMAMLIWSPSFALPNALRAANDARFTMLVSMLSMWIVRVGLAYFFARFTTFGALSVWYAMIIDWTVRSIFFIIRWHVGLWKLHYHLAD
ncbi:MATE family, multidrug efflux pump [Pillotina sp. SPG140]|jgi:putative MATE family efflux protein